MKRFVLTLALLLAIVLMAAACGSGGVRGGEARSVATVPLPEPVAVTAPLLLPGGAVILYYADGRCPPSVPSATLPTRAASDCYATQARLALIRLVRRDKVSPGKASPCYSYLDPTMYANCLDVAARTLPAQAYGLSGQWVKGLLYGEPWSGCAAGYAQRDYVFASLGEPARVLGLVAHEAGNNWMQVTFDRLDLTDGPLISEAVSAARAACGGL